jgi:transcriptional regulator with XRE-family HTH domain
MELRRIRKDRGLRPEHVAIVIGRSNSTVLAYERGRVTPSADALGELAWVLDVPIDDLFTDR